MKLNCKTAAALLASILAMTSCGSSDTFTVRAEIENLGTRNLRVYYYDGKELRTVITPAIDGKFTLEGKSKNPTLLTIQTNLGEPVGSLIARNGEEVKVKLDISNPFAASAEGDADSQLYFRWLAENRELLAEAPSARADSLVASLVGKNRTSAASTLLLVNWFDTKAQPAMADSLLRLVTPDASRREISGGYADMVAQLLQTEPDGKAMPVLELHPAQGDTLLSFNPWGRHRSLYIFTDNASARRDSLNSLFASLKGDKSVSVVNVGLEPDTALWHENLRRTAPVAGVCGWTAGSVASPVLQELKIPVLPYFIVTDSLSKVIYRGTSATAAQLCL